VKSRGEFKSASGLRPMSAFVVIAAVVSTVALWVAHMNQVRAAEQPTLVEREVGERPSYSIVDRRGRPLARFVPRFDLRMSPRAMWQAHTPRYMAERISAALDGEPPAEELLGRMLPDRGDDGFVVVEAWDLSPHQANRLAEWIEFGEEHRVEGVEIRPHPAQPGAYRFAWAPDVLLSRDVRSAQGYRSAWSWARRLARALEGCLRPPGIPEARTPEESDLRRRDIWAALMPCADTVPVGGLESSRVLELRALLAREGVASHQMGLAYERDRSYPAGRHELYGSWGYTSPSQHEPAPRSGLELVCDRLLREDRWASLDYRPSLYLWKRDSAVLGERAHGFLGYAGASPAPRVQTTIDLALQARVRAELEKLSEEHSPALTMAVVLDVDSGDVLAVDSLESYEITPFAPVYHAFTPGSTFKAVTMAIALEEGAVGPGDSFDCGSPSDYRLVDPEGGVRIIHEAEGALGGPRSAAECLAWSINAGLVQIGLRVPPEVFRDYAVRLGYGAKPGSGLGVEQAGYLKGLPWKYRWTHASVTYGHELTTTLWQHAEALATIVRGGVRRPLRLVRGVAQADEFTDLEPQSGSRVFGVDTCSEVRAMMRLGAREGTGAKVLEFMASSERWSAAAEAIVSSQVELATKTGTAQKVPGEQCVHVELEARERWAEEGIQPTRALVKSLRGLPKPHGSCYTSSMCVFARHPETGRELMVLVVTDEPRGKQKFGSKVSGPAEALSLTRDGLPPEEEVVAGFFASSASVSVAADEPWRARKEERP